MAKKKKQQKWIKPRHTIISNLAAIFMKPYCKAKYGATIEPFRAQVKGQPYLILFNHQTAFDQFFVGLSMKCPVYYVASEDIFSMGWISKLIRYIVAPIPIKKQTTDVGAVMACKRVAREGGTIAIAPEGNRTYSGKTEYINPAIVGLIRLLKLPLAFYRIEGGYGVHPRWSNHVRKGKMHCYVSKVLQPDEYAKLTDDELMNLVRQELYVNEGVADATFKHKRLAEGLERAMYFCPKCGATAFTSKKDVVACKKCGMQVRYTPTKELVGTTEPFPYRFVTEWYDAQSEFMRSLDFAPYQDTPLFIEESLALSEVILYAKKKPITKSASLALFADRFEIAYGEECVALPFAQVSAVTVLGKNKLNLYFDGKVWQFKSNSMNALKFVNAFYHYKNIQEGNPHGEFLGI